MTDNGDEFAKFDNFDEDDYGDHERGSEAIVTVEVTGLSLYAHVGVSEAERKIGQRLVCDLTLDVGDCDAVVTDRVEDTTDYEKVCEVVWLVIQQHPYRTLERLAAAVADRLLADFALESVTVKIAKPEPPIALPVSEVAVELWRERIVDAD